MEFGYSPGIMQIVPGHASSSAESSAESGADTPALRLFALLEVVGASADMLVALIQNGAAAVYNPAWLFATRYHQIFLRISQGASRLQEVLADRRAVSAYGSRPFVDGFLVTCVEREGRMTGVDLSLAAQLRDAADGARLTLAGGVATPGDVAALDDLGIDAQVGMALYTGAFTEADVLCAQLRAHAGEGPWPTVVCARVF